MDQRTRCMQFLYGWVTKGHTSNLRKGMVEELQAFVNAEISNEQAQRMAARAEVQQVGTPEDPDAGPSFEEVEKEKA